jgi:hypothetical protein
LLLLLPLPLLQQQLPPLLLLLLLLPPMLLQRNTERPLQKRQLPMCAEPLTLHSRITLRAQ